MSASATQGGRNKATIVFLRSRQCAPLSNTCFFGPTWFIFPNGTLIGSAIFAQLTAHRVPILHSWPSHQNCPYTWGIFTPSSTWLLEPKQVNTTNSILIGTAVFAGLMIVTDRLTDYATHSVTIGCIYIAMQPNNNIVHATTLWPL